MAGCGVARMTRASSNSGVVKSERPGGGGAPVVADELVAPHVPALGEAVEEDHQGAGAGVGVMKPDATQVRVVVGDLDALRRVHRTLLV